MRFVQSVPAILVRLDEFIGRADPKEYANSVGIAVDVRERAALYRAIGLCSPLGNSFTKADDSQRKEVYGRLGIKGLRGYYGGFRILAEEEQ